MMLKDLVLKNRSYRGFDESVRISRETLEGFVDCARLCPSSVNKQPLKYFLTWRGRCRRWFCRIRGNGRRALL